MKIAGAWLNEEGTQALCRALQMAGYRALFVGGCVRNSILGQDVSDIDLSTDALPKTVSDIAETAGFRVVPTGIDHGTVTVIAEGIVHEVTTFRRDVATDGRRAIVAFSDRIEEDAARRDFTMNAIYADPRGDIIDPLGGLDDALARRVRFVGDAAQRIQEDYLRILRFFRFFASYGSPEEGIDPDGLAACSEHSAGLETLSKERVGAEMRKLLAARNPVRAVASMSAAGILSHSLKGADPRFLGPFVHLSDEYDLAPDPIHRLAALGGVDPSRDLRLSKSEVKRLTALRDAIGATWSPGELGYRLGQVDGMAALLLRCVMLDQPAVHAQEVEIGAQAKFPLRAADLPELSGKMLGTRLMDLETRWVASGFSLGKDDLLG